MASPQFTYESQTQAPVRISRRPESSSANVENVGGRLIMNGKASLVFSTIVLIVGIVEVSLTSTLKTFTYGQAIWCSIINVFAGVVAIICGKNYENKSKAKLSILFSYVGVAFSCILLIIQPTLLALYLSTTDSFRTPPVIFMNFNIILFGLVNLLIMATNVKFSSDVFNKQNSNSQQVVEDQVVQRPPYSMSQDDNTVSQQGASQQHNNPSSMQNYPQFSPRNPNFSQINQSFAHDNQSSLENNSSPPRYEDIKL